jgi:hypothetical protein
VNPAIGNMLVRDVRTPHVVELFKAIRATPSKGRGVLAECNAMSARSWNGRQPGSPRW